MEKFAYATPADVAPLIKGGLTKAQGAMLEQKLAMLSAKLSGMFPGLRQVWTDAEEDSDLKNFVTAMITEAGRKFINNPEEMSSETIGVFAYSRLESKDEGPFPKEDLQALKAMLDAELQEQVGSFRLNMGHNAYPAAPMPTPVTYSNTRTRRSWQR